MQLVKRMFYLTKNNLNLLSEARQGVERKAKTKPKTSPYTVHRQRATHSEPTGTRGDKDYLNTSTGGHS